MDEDNPEGSGAGSGLHGPSATSTEEGLEVAEGSSTALSGSRGSGLDLASIASSHREKSRTQQDLKRQFEEFSRNLSLGRSRSRRGNKRNQSPKKKVKKGAYLMQ